MEYINDLLKVEVQDYVALVTIDHPPLNILTLKLSAQMRDTLHCLEEDDAVRVVVLRGAGERHSVWERISRSFHRCGMM